MEVLIDWAKGEGETVALHPPEKRPHTKTEKAKNAQKISSCAQYIAQCLKAAHFS